MCDHEVLEVLTMGELIRGLRVCNPQARVRFDFTNCIPTRIAAWRGVYAEPALGWQPSGYTQLVKEYPTVASLLLELEDSLTKIYEGWKGGEFSYSPDSPVHVDNEGDCTITHLVGLERTWRSAPGDEFEVILKTAQFDT